MTGSATTSTSSASPPPLPRRKVWAAAAVAGVLVLSTVLWLDLARDDATGPSSAASAAKFPWELDRPPPSLVPLDEIRSGGPPPDGIPPIDEPKFVSTRAADAWLGEREPVLSLVHKGEARAYPLQIMTWHEIANDEVAGDPITVTFCPLCNSAIAFGRRVERTVLDFGTSGRLYKSNLVMYDRQSKSLWIQFTGQSVTGRFMGTDLKKIPVQIVSWTDFARAHPDGRVLSRDTGHGRDYGSNPYAGYDDVDSTPFLFDGRANDRLPAMDRVLTVTFGKTAKAYRYEDLAERARAGVAVVTDRVAGEEIVIFYSSGTASALDGSDIASSKDVGATGIFRSQIDHRGLSFEARDAHFIDEQTGSTWNVLGRSTSGPLRGKALKPVVHDDTFWFVWAAFRPGTTIWDDL